MANCGAKRMGRKGFTLVEVLIALAISGLLMTAVYSAFQSQQKSYLAQDQVAEMQQNIRAALSAIVQELRMAGYDPYRSGTAGITVAEPTRVTFTMVANEDDIDNDNADGDNDTSTGADETGELKTITFMHYDAYGDGVMDIGRQVGFSASSKRAIAENIEELEFYYTLKDGTQTLTPTALDDIRSIEISILAITNHPDRNYTNTESYTSASGEDWTPATKVNYRRRFRTITVKLRNMGI